MKSPSRTVRSRAGFTLIELLTVIAIIGILAAILIPTVGAVREKAKTAQCAARIRQWGSAVNLYAADNKNVYRVTRADGYLPWCISGSTDDPNPYAKYFSVPTPNLEESEMIYCPTKPEARSIGGNTPGRAGYVMIWPSYRGVKVTDPLKVPLSRATTPSRTLLMIDRQYTTTSGELAAAETGNGASFSIEDTSKMRPSYSNFDRHNNYANAVFLDGSVRRMKWNTGDANTSLSTAQGALAGLNTQWFALDQ